MLTSAQIRQSFLDFFREKQHTIVPSSSLLPDSPNLLFTNAGMNQFVPIFLGQKAADVSKWGNAISGGDGRPAGADTRAADTQKCIRAGGKHNDLEDVGLDTYHHTFFEMLGNWSFGDYFKRDAIAWAWELIVGRWGFPPNRVYATVYCPHMDMERWQRELDACIRTVRHGAMVEWTDDAPGATAIERSDRESVEYWAELFIKADMNPAVHIVPGNKKDNFWMMGDTGPCGPCSELHIDLTPDGNTQGSLVNKGDARCIEIWNLVFIQFNANPDGTFSPLPAKHVDTGMGFERVASIIQGTRGFSDFANAKISNYETDVFRPIFDELEALSGKRYASTLPLPNAQGQVIPTSGQEKIDVAFRVIADHIRTLSFAVADGIQPGNTDRNYVLRRILRRAVRYGRTLGFREPFFFKLVNILARTMGDVFPAIRSRRELVQDVLRREEEAFSKTLDRGLQEFEAMIWSQNQTRTNLEPVALNLGDIVDRFTTAAQRGSVPKLDAKERHLLERAIIPRLEKIEAYAGLAASERLKVLVDTVEAYAPALSTDGELATRLADDILRDADYYILLGNTLRAAASCPSEIFSGKNAFTLYDTYGFPLDLTELMARERGLTVDVAGFEKLMEEQRTRARAAQKKQIIELSQIETTQPTHFVGYDALATEATVLEVVALKDKTAVILDTSTAYAEMGGQVGDTGEIAGGGQLWNVLNTQKSGNTWLHFIEPVMGEETPAVGSQVTLCVDTRRRAAIQRHHTVTHLLHWALHEIVSRDATQKGSFVGPDKLTFDFQSAALTPAQVRDVERLVNERIVENAPVTWSDVPYQQVKGREDIMQFFGDKYGERVRVVQIGGQPFVLDGYSMELCAGTHVSGTGEIGLFRIASEGAVAAGVRRIEAVAGLPAYDFATADAERLKALAAKLGSPLPELEKKLEAMLAGQKEMERQLESLRKKQAAATAANLVGLAQLIGGKHAIIERIEGATGDELQTIADALKAAAFKGVVFLAGTPAPDQVALLASVSSDLTSTIQAGKLIQNIAPVVGGKGGGRPDNARGAGKDAGKIADALMKVRELLA